MQLNKKKKVYSLSSRDLAVMSQAKVGFGEVARVAITHSGLPPLWSKLPYLMLVYDTQGSTKHFWKAYREFVQLLKTRDSHYRHSYIPKNSGGTRELLVPDWELRRHQRYILKNILYKIPVSDNACAYHKHRGLTDLASPHIGHDVLIHIDIKDFFSSISEQMVYEVIRKETGYPDAVVGFLSRLCCYKRYLPQGACTSPALSNICFKDCDAELTALAKRKGMAYSRYSDDIYLSGNNINARRLLNEAKKIILNHGFRVHGRKTKIIGQHQAQKITAIIVNKKLQVTREYRRKLRQEIYYLKKFEEKSKAARESEDYLHYLHQLQGKISFVLYVDPENKEFLAAQKVIEDKIDSCRYEYIPFW